MTDEDSLPAEELEDLWEDTEESQETALARAEVKRRCAATDISFEEKVDAEGEEYLLIQMPSGRDSRPMFARTLRYLKRLISMDFEKYIYLSDYEAICSYKDGTIEAIIRPIGQGLILQSDIYRRLFNVKVLRNTDPEKITLNLRPNDESINVSISIGPMSEELDVLCERRNMSSTAPSLKISGLNVSQHDKAVEYLERYSNALFFEIDLAINFPISLAKDRRRLRTNRALVRQQDSPEFQFPRCEYDREPISLYWYARSARGMPLLQYLAFYQSIEFYFPIYSQIDTQRRVRNILKDPTFNPHKDADVGRLLGAVRFYGNRGYGDERSQLRATIQECVNPQSLKDFMETDNDRKEFFSSKQKKLNVHKLPIANPEADLRNDVADRIYDIRCKIVHTKNVQGEDTLDLLLPFSKEAEVTFI